MNMVQVTDRARQELQHFRDEESGRVCVRFFIEMEGG